MVDRTEKQTTAEIERIYKNYYAYIERPGAADLLQWMCANGFFEAPASTKYHSAEPGGLAKHSINVYKRIFALAGQEERKNRQAAVGYTVETLAIVALLHDLCKIDAYKEAKEGSDRRYEATRRFPAGHGEKSVVLIMRFMHLTDEEILAIRWHMGQYDFSAMGGSNDLNNTFSQCKLAVMLHIADMMATHLDEAEVAQR